MKKIQKFTIFFLSFCTFIIGTPIVFAETASTSTTTLSSLPNQTLTNASSSAASLGLQTPAVPPLIQDIEQAKLSLATTTLGHTLNPIYKNVKNKKTKKVTKTLTGYTLGTKDIALAILNPLDNSVTITVGKQNGKTMTFSDPAVNVKLTSFNGVNSKFQVTVPSGGTILALKYLISGTESGSKAAIENSLSEALYVPYSPSLNDPAVIQYGADYLNGIIKNVANDLQNFPSAAIPGQTITQAIPPAMIKALVYAEHTDTAQVLNGDINGTINQLNILFATNQGDAYKYSVSTAGARGIAQFIPSTYNSLVQRHPEAGLISDFVTGMSDHTNSIKAMYLLLDDYAGAVRVKAAQGFASGRVFDYAAASYNGGTTRVAKAINTYGSDWNSTHDNEINSLQSQIQTLRTQAANLKAKIKKTTDKKTKSSLQSQLTAAQSQASSASNQLSALQAATLRDETINYLNKIYKVINVFNDQVV